MDSDREDLGKGHEVTDSDSRRSKRLMQALQRSAASVEALVESARSGNREAFDELVKRTTPDTYTLARRLVSNEEDARDVVQEAYLRAYRSLNSFRGDASFSTWMYRITANCASTYLGRRRRHRHDDIADEVDMADSTPENDPAIAADGKLLRERLEAAIAQLPPRLRSVVVLRDIYDMNHAEIADQLAISESAAKVRLHRARRRLRTQVFPLSGEPGWNGGADLEEQANAS